MLSLLLARLAETTVIFLGILLIPFVVAADDKYALLVGVTKYEHSRMNASPLKYPETDAKAVAEVLQASGYKVDILLGKQATQEGIRKALEKAGLEGSSDGAVVLGFFGHGVQYDKTAFYCPYDTKPRVVKDSQNREIRDKQGKLKLEPDPKHLVSMRKILDALTTCGAKNRILLADCCREDPTRARGRTAFGSSLSVNDLPSGTVAMFACSKDEQAFEHDDWKHGAFTYALLEHFRALSATGKVTSGKLSDEVFDTVQKIVKDKTDGQFKQTVYSLSSGRVNFLLKTALKKRLKNSIGMEFALIPRGTFLMGSPEDEEGRKDDETQHRVTLTKDYYLGIHEVTQGQWRAVMGTEPWLEDGKPKTWVKKGRDYPATYVSWEDAVEFCKKLSTKDGGNYRLPTEAEWERACRGDTQTRFSFGDSTSDLADYAWYDKNAYDVDEKYAHRVGQKKANVFGVYDMHGNVYEWCSDKYGTFSDNSVVDPTGPTQGSRHVNRGGSWYHFPSLCRSAYRFRTISPDNPSYTLGFRVVRSSE